MIYFLTCWIAATIPVGFVVGRLMRTNGEWPRAERTDIPLDKGWNGRDVQ